MFALQSELHGLISLSAARPQCGRFVFHSPPHGDMAQSLPDTVDLRHDGLICLFEVYGIGVRHPARPAGDPEHFSTVVLRVKEVATNCTAVVGDPIDAIALCNQTAVKRTQIIEGSDTHRDLVD